MGLGLVTLLLPIQYYTTAQKVANGSSVNETGLGVQYEWFATPSLSLGGLYEANVNVGKSAVMFTGFDVGANSYLVGGASENYSSTGVTFVSSPRQHVFYGLFLSRREFDFSAFDSTRDAAVLEGPRPVTSGSFVGPSLQVGWEMGFSQNLRAGLRACYVEGLVASESIRVRLFEARVSVGVAL